MCSLAGASGYCPRIVQGYLVLPEPDSALAHRLVDEVIVASGGRLFALDIAFCEAANVVWKHQTGRAGRAAARLSEDDARFVVAELRASPVGVKRSARLLGPALDLAMRYDKTVYDALFVAAADDFNLQAVTTDEPLQLAVKDDFPRVVLLRDWQPR